MKIEKIASILGFRLFDGVYVKDVFPSGYQLVLQNVSVYGNELAGSMAYGFSGWLKIPAIRIGLDQILTPATRKAISKRITKNPFANKIPFIGNGPIIEYQLNGFRESKKDKVLEAIDNLIRILQEYKLGPQLLCPVCRQEIKEGEMAESTFDFKFSQNVKLRAHAGCAAKRTEHAISEIKATEQNKDSIPMSILISLGMSLAAVGGILVALFVFRVWLGYFFILIPLLGVVGWKLGKAPFNRLASVIIIGETVLVVAGLMIWYVALVADANGASFADAAVLCMEDLIFAGGTTVLGILLNYKNLFQATNEARLKKLNK